MTRPVSLSTSSPRCSPLILALSSAASSPSASPTAPISPALLALAAAPGTILGAHASSQQMQVAAAREAPSPLLLASSPILASTSNNVTPSSSTVNMTSASASSSPLLAAPPPSAPYQRSQVKCRNPAFTMSMPSPPRFVSNANVNRMYAAQSSLQPLQQQPSQPSDATPYLMPVGSPLGPVTPMLLADEEFQFPQPSTSPSLSSSMSGGSSLSSSAGSTSSQSWARHRQVRYPQQQQQPPIFTTGSAAGLARVAPYSSSTNPPTSSRQVSSMPPSPSPLSPLSPALSESILDDDDVDYNPKKDL
ncbi:hypothetical protein V1509DRAFT_627358 [Lipomyces kononenkoae]